MDGTYLLADAIYTQRKRMRFLPHLELLEIGHA
jgi:hypothetical protein